MGGAAIVVIAVRVFDVPAGLAMNRSFLIGCCVLSAGACLPSPGWGQDAAPATLAFRISPETTHITEPLTPTGLVDYVAWLNRDLSQGITPETNAAVLYWQAIGKNDEFPQEPEIVERLIRGLGVDPFADEGPTIIGLDRIARAAQVEVDFNDGSTLGTQYNLAMERPWKPHEAPLVYKWLYVNKKPLETVLQGTKRPHYYRPLFGTVDNDTMFGLSFPEIQPFRELARMLSARSLLALGENRSEDAIEDLMAIHRFARHLARGGTIYHVRVGIALDAIAHKGDRPLANSEAVTADQLSRYAKQLSELPPLGDLQRSYLFERFAGLDLIQRLASRQMPGVVEFDVTHLLEMFGLETDSEVANRLMSLVIQHGVEWNQVMIGFNEHFDRVQNAFEHDKYAQRYQALSKSTDELERRIQAISSLRVLVASVFATPQQRAELMTAMLLNNYRGLYVVGDDEALNNGNAKIVVCQIGVALAAYQKANGKFPASIEVLVPEYLPKLPNDPYTGKPCFYRVDDKGALVYSLGKTLKDDGGKKHARAFRVKSNRAQ